MTDKLTLRDIATAVLKKHEASGRGLNVIAEKRGHRLNYTTINAMAAGTYKSRATKATLDALVDLSDYDEAQVYAAAGRPIPLRPFAEDLPDGADSLRAGQREAVLAVVRQFMKDNEQKEVADHGKEDPTPNSQAPADGANKRRVRRGKGRGGQVARGGDGQHPDEGSGDR